MWSRIGTYLHSLKKICDEYVWRRSTNHASCIVGYCGRLKIDWRDPRGFESHLAYFFENRYDLQKSTYNKFTPATRIQMTTRCAPLDLLPFRRYARRSLNYNGRNGVQIQEQPYHRIQVVHPLQAAEQKH